MLPLAKVLSTEATAEWMVAEGILQTIIVNYDLSSFFDANGSHWQSGFHLFHILW